MEKVICKVRGRCPITGRVIEIFYCGKRKQDGKFVLTGAAGHISPLCKKADVRLDTA